QYQDRVSYYSVDGKLVAADARSVADGGTALRGHTAFEEYRYDALGRRVWTRARRWCDDVTGATGGADAVACEISSVTRTVWDGSRELAEIEMPATDSTASSTVENDTLAIVRSVPGTGDALYDANRLYGQVIYVNGLETDQPLAITRNHYADASSTTGSATYAVYAPFSIIPLWNSQGRADQSVIGGTAAPGQDYLCADTGKTRCANVSLDWGVFPYARSGAATGSWQGTLLLDKPDAAGTYYRRNRSYDPSTARFTQEDPIGLAGGINEYGFASGDPANYGDPFGLCCSSSDVATITSQLARLAPQMNHEILWFIPKNLAAALTGLTAEAGIGRLISAARSVLGGASEAGATVGTTSLYKNVTTGSSVGNIATDVSQEEFESNLMNSGWKQSISKDGEVNIFIKDGARYTVRGSSKSFPRNPTVEYFAPGNKGAADIKIRLPR
ncbi:MAG: RHS repeat-associated core domain-containing protein, partial [Edaphobacter sp.]